MLFLTPTTVLMKFVPPKLAKFTKAGIKVVNGNRQSKPLKVKSLLKVDKSSLLGLLQLLVVTPILLPMLVGNLLVGLKILAILPVMLILLKIYKIKPTTKILLVFILPKAIVKNIINQLG